MAQARATVLPGAHVVGEVVFVERDVHLGALALRRVRDRYRAGCLQHRRACARPSQRNGRRCVAVFEPEGEVLAAEPAAVFAPVQDELRRVHGARAAARPVALLAFGEARL